MDTNGFSSKAWAALRVFLQARQRGVDNLDTLSDVNVRSLPPDASSKLKAILDATLIGVSEDVPKSRRDSDRTSLRNLCMKFRLQEVDTGTGIIVVSDGVNSPSSLAIARSAKRYSKVVPTDLHRVFALGAVLEVLHGSFKEPEDTEKEKGREPPPIKRIPAALSDQVILCLQRAGLFAGGKYNGAITSTFVQRLLSELRRHSHCSISVPALIREISAARTSAELLSTEYSLAVPGFGLYPNTWVIPPLVTKHMEATALLHRFLGGMRMSIVVPKAVAVSLLKRYLHLERWEHVVRNVIFRTDASVVVMYRCFRHVILRSEGSVTAAAATMGVPALAQVRVRACKCPTQIPV